MWVERDLLLSLGHGFPPLPLAPVDTHGHFYDGGIVRKRLARDAKLSERLVVSAQPPVVVLRERDVRLGQVWLQRKGAVDGALGEREPPFGPVDVPEVDQEMRVGEPAVGQRVVGVESDRPLVRLDGQAEAPWVLRSVEVAIAPQELVVRLEVSGARHRYGFTLPSPESDA